MRESGMRIGRDWKTAADLFDLRGWLGLGWGNDWDGHGVLEERNSRPRVFMRIAGQSAFPGKKKERTSEGL